MTRQTFRDTTNRLRQIQLTDVLRAAGASADQNDPARWNSTRGPISVTGTKFFNWKLATGGGGAIDLVIHLMDADFKNAIAWLEARFPQTEPKGIPEHRLPTELRLPQPDKRNMTRVIQYLCGKRRLPETLVIRLVHNGDLYADPFANAVFIMRSVQNRAVGAELRGTGPRIWRGMAPGSKKQRGFFGIQNDLPSSIILCESAIDAISCLAIHPSSRCVSTAGARPDPEWLPEIIQQNKNVYCGFDSDTVGESMAQDMTRRYPAISRLRPDRHDWNECLMASHP